MLTALLVLVALCALLESFWHNGFAHPTLTRRHP